MEVCFQVVCEVGRCLNGGRCEVANHRAMCSVCRASRETGAMRLRTSVQVSHASTEASART